MPVFLLIMVNCICIAVFVVLSDIYNNYSYMGWGVNQKATEKRQREAAKKSEQNQKQQQRKQRQKWKDGYTQKKLQQAQHREEKRQQELARKKQMKQLVAKQEAEMQKQSKKNKGEFNQQKLTQAQLYERLQKIQKQNQKKVEQSYPEQNINKKLQDCEIATTIQQSLDLFQQGQERHPEKRFKAAFEAFCQKREEEIKIDYPKLKKSQRLQMMRKQFEKHGDNPYNKKNVVEYNYKKDKKVEIEEQEQNDQK